MTADKWRHSQPTLTLDEMVVLKDARFGVGAFFWLAVLTLLGCEAGAPFAPANPPGSGGVGGSGRFGTATGGSGGGGGVTGSAGAGGSVGNGGTGGSSVGAQWPCTEQGILDAIEAGGGTHTFDCNGPTTVTTTAEIVVDNDVVLDGGGDLRIDGGDDHRVLFIPQERTVELRNLSVTGGLSSGNTLAAYGGGIRNEGTLTLTDCVVSDNTCEGGGGGIATRGVLTLVRTSVFGNQAVGLGGDGGGIYLQPLVFVGELIAVDSQIYDNAAADFGGGVLSNFGDVDLTRCTVENNTARFGGGVMIFRGGTWSLTDSTVARNTATTQGGGVEAVGDGTISRTLIDSNSAPTGAGIYSGFNLEVIDSTVSNNVGGGTGVYGGPELIITNSTVSNNEGTGVFAPRVLAITGSTISGNGNSGLSTSGDVTVTNTTISGNTGIGGGGVRVGKGGDVTLTNCTISGNTATVEGGGLYNETVAMTVIRNCTIVDNTAPVAAAIFNDEFQDNGTTRTEVRIANSIVQGSCGGDTPLLSDGGNIESPGASCAFADPNDQAGVSSVALALGPLQQTCGTLQTHSLMSGSTAIDSVPSASCLDAAGAPLVVDQCDAVRPQGAACDAGAIEAE